MDAERIDGRVRHVEFLSRAAIEATGLSEPERIWRARDEAIAKLQQQAPTMSEDELIAYALRRQQEVRGTVS